MANAAVVPEKMKWQVPRIPTVTTVKKTQKTQRALEGDITPRW